MEICEGHKQLWQHRFSQDDAGAWAGVPGMSQCGDSRRLLSGAAAMLILGHNNDEGTQWQRAGHRMVDMGSGKDMGMGPSAVNWLLRIRWIWYHWT